MVGRVILAKKLSAGALPAMLVRDFGLSCAPGCDTRDAREVFVAREPAGLLEWVEIFFFAGTAAFRLVRLEVW